MNHNINKLKYQIRKVIRKIISESMEDSPNVSTSDKFTNLRRYVQDNIDLTGYGDFEKTPDSQKIQAVIEIFNDEKGWDIKIQGLKRAFIDWLQGLPSILDLPFYYYDIKNLLYSLGYDEVQEMEDDQISKLYYDELFKVFFKK